MSAKIWIVLQQRDGKIQKMSWEAVRAGQALAADLGGTAEAVLLGSGMEEAGNQVGQCSLGSVHVADDESLAVYTPGRFARTLEAAIATAQPDYVLFPHTYQTVDFLPGLAQSLNAALVPEAVSFETVDGSVVWQRPVLGGKMFASVRAKGPGPVLASLQSGAFSADELEKGSAPIETLSLDFAAMAADREILGIEEAVGGEVDLSQAPVIVSVGRGIGDAEKMPIMQELADALGGELGASRPVIDSGWLPRDRQIGSSGQTVTPKLYVAAGISGAIQHLVGMKGSQVIVAINKDAGAPIFNVAHYGIVGDLHEVVPAVTAALKEASES
ncbi:MAG: electron transfer flavoprotein subunit alpha/FixB family protein [Thermoanaerobaculia bacterium]